MTRRLKPLPVALTIAGSDSGGGAGIQADLKTFAACGVHGTSAITCITAQNPSSVRAIQAVRIPVVASQIEAVMDELPPAAIKTGMLYSEGIIGAVANCLKRYSPRPVVVDPVMVSTSGALLLKTGAVKALCRELLPGAALVTPNLDEAEILVGYRLRSVEDLRKAARAMHRQYGCAVLAKGGHLRGLKQAVDIFFDGREELLLSAPFARGVSTHGTGCTYSAAIAAFLARGLKLSEAVFRAKEHITQAICGSRAAGRHSVLNSFWRWTSS